MKRGTLDTETDRHRERRPSEGEGRDQGNASISQRAPNIAIKSLEGQKEAWSRFSLTASGGISPVDTWISDLQPAEM